MERGSSARPMRSTTRALGLPRRRAGSASTITRSPVRAVPISCGWIENSVLIRLSVGVRRPKPSLPFSNSPTTRCARLSKPPDRARLVDVGIGLLQRHQHAVAGGQRPVDLLVVDDDDLRLGVVGALVDRARPQIAVGVGADHLHDRHLGQLAGRRQLFAIAVDLAFLLQLLEQRLERDAVRAFQVESARDLALADRAFALADEGEDLFLGGEGDMLRTALLSRLRRRRPAVCQACGALNSISIKANS